jgi:AcrR family transcriptional regulator
MTQTLRQQRKEELRERILESARQLFVTAGYQAFSMRKLAEEIGCSAGNLYLYFDSREALFRHLVDDAFAQLHDRVAGGEVVVGANDVRRRRDALQSLAAGLRAYVDFGVANPDAYRMAFLVRRPSPKGPVTPHGAFDVLRANVARCVREKRFRAVDVELASQSIWTAVHGVTSLLVQLPHFPWVDRDKLIATVIAGAVAPFVRHKKGMS